MSALAPGAVMEALIPHVRAAGAAIMDVQRAPVDADTKTDGSPVTEADRAAEEILLRALDAIAPDVQVVSEENAASHRTAASGLFFLVDPLDGTKEFLRKDGQGAFTVNVGLVRDGAAIAGVVFAPAHDRLFVADIEKGAREIADGRTRALAVRAVPESGPVAIASRSHRDAETDAWLTAQGITQTVAFGSSLKFCLLAAGEADVYPRFGPTMEWDTAAGEAVLIAAGGRVETPDGARHLYGKPDYRNGPFIARGAF